jgi:hypothetical protein
LPPRPFFADRPAYFLLALLNRSLTALDAPD